MPRQPRSFHVGGIYHIVQRGVEKRKIFLKRQDYSRFILALEFFNSRMPVDFWNSFIRARGGTVPPRALAEKLREHRRLRRRPIVQLLAFTLMPNHFHLVVKEIQEGGISLFMRKLGGYATYFNRQYDRVGSLFQSRFKAIEMESDVQLRLIFSYVHTNPVELWEPKWKEFQAQNPTRALEKLGEYRWSSYRDFIGKPGFPQATDREFFLKVFGGRGGCQNIVEDWVRQKGRFKDDAIDDVSSLE